MTVTTATNGKQRKNLSDQIDRLDGILDGLGEGLNEAVSTAVTRATAHAVQEAVRQALVEVLTNPDVLALVAGAARMQAPASNPAPAQPGPGLGQRLGDWAGQKVRAAQEACGRGVAAGLGGLQSVRGHLRALWHVRLPLLVALSVGVAAGSAGYVAGPWAAGLLSGLAGFASALAVQARLWLADALAGFAPADREP